MPAAWALTSASVSVCYFYGNAELFDCQQSLCRNRRASGEGSWASTRGCIAGWMIGSNGMPARAIGVQRDVRHETQS
jgi:hypothetical protein